MRPAKSESILIDKIRDGDEYAFEIVFLKYYEPLCKFSWKYVRSNDLAEEIVQEVLASLWENRCQLDPSGHLRGLLYENARNKALNYIKHQKVVDRYIAETKQQKREDSYYVISHEKEFSGIMEAANLVINELPPRSRHIYKLNREEGLTYKEIAKYLNISVKTVESQMRRALAILRDRLFEYLPIPVILFNYMLVKHIFYIVH